MRGDARIARPEASAVSDPPSSASSGSLLAPIDTAATLPNASSEDVRSRLGLEDTADGDEPHDRPRFLDFSDPAPAVEKPEAPEPANEVPAFLKLSDIRRVSDQPPSSRDGVKLAEHPPAAQATEGDKSSFRSGLTWLAVAALIAFVALGVLEWRYRSTTPTTDQWKLSGRGSRASCAATTSFLRPPAG